MIDFPSSPQIGDSVLIGDCRYVFDGTSWTTRPFSFGFSFAEQLDQEMEVTATSEGQQISIGAAVSIVDGEYQIASNSDFSSIVTDWTSDAGTIAADQYIRVRHTTATAWETDAITTMTIGGVSSQFRSKTRASISIYLSATGTNNWTVPDNWYDGCNKIEGIGGGANGTGNQNGPGNVNPGGGGGAYAIAENVSLTPGGTVSYSLNAGSDSVFGSVLVADGASGVTGGQAANCTPSTGAISGQNGTYYNASGSSAAGGDGGAAAGPNGLNTGWTVPSVVTAGAKQLYGLVKDGNLYGGGATGGWRNANGGTGANGGNGRPGILRVTY